MKPILMVINLLSSSLKTPAPRTRLPWAFYECVSVYAERPRIAILVTIRTCPFDTPCGAWPCQNFLMSLRMLFASSAAIHSVCA